MNTEMLNELKNKLNLSDDNIGKLKDLFGNISLENLEKNTLVKSIMEKLQVNEIDATKIFDTAKEIIGSNAGNAVKNLVGGLFNK